MWFFQATYVSTFQSDSFTFSQILISWDGSQQSWTFSRSLADQLPIATKRQEMVNNARLLTGFQENVCEHSGLTYHEHMRPESCHCASNVPELPDTGVSSHFLYVKHTWDSGHCSKATHNIAGDCLCNQIFFFFPWVQRRVSLLFKYHYT